MDLLTLAVALKNGGGGGGGTEKFSVTLIKTQNEGDIKYTADKSIAQICEADAAGKICTAKIPFEDDGNLMDAQLFVTDHEDFVGFDMVLPGTPPTLVVATGETSPQGDTWTVAGTDLAMISSIPEEFHVTISGTGSEGDEYHSDKTCDEIIAAYESGKIIVGRRSSDNRPLFFVCANNHSRQEYRSVTFVGYGTPDNLSIDLLVYKINAIDESIVSKVAGIMFAN